MVVLNTDRLDRHIVQRRSRIASEDQLIKIGILDRRQIHRLVEVHVDHAHFGAERAVTLAPNRLGNYRSDFRPEIQPELTAKVFAVIEYFAIDVCQRRWARTENIDLIGVRRQRFRESEHDFVGRVANTDKSGLQHDVVRTRQQDRLCECRQVAQYCRGRSGL